MTNDSHRAANFAEKHKINYHPINLKLIKKYKNNSSECEKNEDESDKLVKKLQGEKDGGMPKPTDFRNRKELVETKKVLMKQGYPFSHIAFETSNIYQIDIDCINYHQMFKDIMKHSPYTISTTKKFGRHIFITSANFTPPKDRLQFKKVYGKAVELLCGQWSWCKANAKVYNAEKPIFEIPNLEEYLDLPTTSPPQCNDTLPLNHSKAFNYALIKENMERIKKETLEDYQKAVGIILKCASTGDKRIYEILQQVMSNADNYNDNWVKKKWDEYDPIKHASYHFDFDTEEEYEKPTEITNTSIAEYLLNVYGNDFIYAGATKELYYWNGDIWERDVEGYIHRLIEKNIYLELTKYVVTLNDCKAKDNIIKKVLLLHNEKFRQNTLKSFVRMCKMERLVNVAMNYNDAQKHYVHFKNGCVNLKTGEFRKRTKTDYVSVKLNYDYKASTDKGVVEQMKILEPIIKRLQQCKQQYDLMMMWKAYCLTGETKEQKFMMAIGYSAGNGKSTLLKIHSITFPIYTAKFSNDCFTKNNSQSDRDFSKLIDNPIRLIFIEELDDKPQDVNKFNDVVDGYSITIRQLYKEKVNIIIHAKVGTTSNFDPNFSNKNKGILRRLVIQFFQSKFVVTEEELEQKKKDGYKNVYIGRQDIDSLFLNNDMKLAYFYLLLPYCKKYYENGLIIPKENLKFSNNIIEDYDEFNEVFEKNFEKKANEKTSKVDVQNRIKENNQFKDMPWRDILKQMKQRGFTYNSQMRKQGKRGFFIGLKLKPYVNEIESDDEA
jgi:phage/plasmid-associated DNA primase